MKQNSGYLRLKEAFSSVKSADLFFILLLGAAFRLFYYSNLLDSIVIDSPTYLNHSSNLLKGQVDVWRTPLYPYFLKLIKQFVNQKSFIHSIVIIQSLISFLTIITFYKVVNKIFENRYAIITSTLFYAISPSLVNFDKCVLTESLSISFIVIFISLIFRFIKNPTKLKALLNSLLIVVAIMLRPSFIVLIPIMSFFWVLRLFFIRSERSVSLMGLSGTFIAIILLTGYSKLNDKRNGFNGLTAVSSYNQIDLLIAYNIFENGNDDEMSKTIRANLVDTSKEVFHLKVQHALFSTYPPNRIKKFIRNSIINHLSIFVQKSIVRIYLLENEKISTIYAERKNGYMGVFNFILRANFITFLVVYLLLIIELIYIVFQWYMEKRIVWFRIVLWTIIITQLALVILGAQAEFQRLFVIALPCLIIVFFFYVDMLLYSIVPQKFSEYGSLNKY
jgi:hypothetical protein